VQRTESKDASNDRCMLYKLTCDEVLITRFEDEGTFGTVVVIVLLVDTTVDVVVVGVPVPEVVGGAVDVVVVVVPVPDVVEGTVDVVVVVVPVPDVVEGASLRLDAVEAVARAAMSCATRSAFLASKAVIPIVLNSFLMSFTDILTGSITETVEVGPEVPLVVAGLVDGVGPLGEGGGVVRGEGVGEVGGPGGVGLNLLVDDEPLRDLFLVLGIVGLRD